MRSQQVGPEFGLEHLHVVESDDPRPGPGQVRLRMRAVSLNYRDLLMVRGHYDPRLARPFVPCSDGVGEVVEVGEDVTRVAVGDRVCPTFSPTWIAGSPDWDAVRRTRGGTVPGVLADQVVEHESALVKIPDGIDDEAASTLPCAALTAWSALFTEGGVGPGDTVLTLGTGGVSIFALQLAQLAGARVVATTSSQSKAERLWEMGAAHVVDYVAEPKWGRVVRQWSGGGVDHVVEVGGAGTLSQSLEAVRPGGTVSLIGVLSGTREPVNVLPVLMRQVRVQGILVGHREAFEAMVRAIDASGLEPVIDRVFHFADARAAFEHLASGTHLGKVVIRIR